MAKVNKYKKGLISSKDILNGYKAYPTGTDFWTVAPIQCIPEEEKDEYWKKHNADWFENIALKKLPAKSKKYQKLSDLKSGIINKSDYLYNPENNELTNIIGNDNEDDLLNMFFPIAPNIHNVFIGEFIKRDKACILQAIDEESVNEAITFKEEKIRDSIAEFAMRIKQNNVSHGTQEEEESSKRLIEIENKFKKYRTRAVNWGNKFIEKYRIRNNMDEIIERLFSDAITYDEYIFALDLRENDFIPMRMDPRKTHVMISPSKTDYSDATAIVHIDFMTLPDIINTFRDELTEDQVKVLELNYNTTISNTILSPAQMQGDGYYDTSASYEENMKYGTNVRQTMSTQAINDLFTSNSNNVFNNYSNMFENTKMTRVSKIWWCSQKLKGLVTSIDEDNNLVIKEVDENFKVTEPPIYDNSLLKEKSSKTLIKGEHVEWRYINDWRFIIKIGRNLPNKLIESDTLHKNIYIKGDSIKFQFKSPGNQYDAKPPIQGRRLSDNSSIQNSLINKLRPWQIHFNILLNKILPILSDDIGPVLVANESDLENNSLEETDGIEPLTEMLDSIRRNKVILNKDLDSGKRLNGRSKEIRVVDLSTADKIQTYLNLALQIKQQAFDSIGVSPQRLADIGKSESATGVTQAVQSSVNQTEIYFDTFLSKGLPKLWQLIIDAGQWYTSKYPEFMDSYVNSDDDRVLFEVQQEDLFRDLMVNVLYSAQTREFLNTIKQLAMQDNTMGATFLDKVKTLKSSVPSEIIEQLQLAEYKRDEQERLKYEQETKLQQQREDAALERQEKMMQDEMQKFYDKLNNDYNIALVKADKQSQTPDNSVEYDRMQQKDNHFQTGQDLEREKLASKNQESDKAYQLRQKELDIKQRKNELDYAIAVENKQSADVKFKQLKK